MQTTNEKRNVLPFSSDIFAARFASALSFALQNNEPNLLSPDAFYDPKMHQNASADGGPGPGGAYSDGFKGAVCNRRKGEGTGKETG